MCRCRPIYSSLSGRVTDKVCLISAHFLPLMSCFLQRLPKPGGWDCCLVMLYVSACTGTWKKMHWRAIMNYHYYCVLSLTLDTATRWTADIGTRSSDHRRPLATSTPDTDWILGLWLMIDWQCAEHPFFLSSRPSYVLNNKPAQMLVNSI